MLYLLIRTHWVWLQAHHLGFLRVFTRDQDPFRHTAAILISFISCILLGPGIIRWLRKQKIGDAAHFDHAGMDTMMAAKTGTPTMGGILILSAIFISAALLADLQNFHVRMALLCMVFLGGLGAVDDWLKRCV